MREKLASRLGFIFLSAGCAIGLGNVWRFPYMVGQNGGGWFVAIYLACLALIGLPVLVMEFACGRAAQRPIVGLHAALTPGRAAWRAHGAAGLAGCVLLMMFYTTVTGWMAIYLVKMSRGAFAGLDPRAVGGVFDALRARPGPMAAAMLAVSLGAAAVCAAGLQKGLERATKWMMLCLLALIAVLAANSLRLDGAARGLEFYLVPDLARMKAAGGVAVVVEAMNHAFFTLSLGVGSMAVFGSYIGRERTLLGEALNVCALDTAVALAAGLIILPACFAFGVPPAQGPGLVFVTLPNVFNHMPAGRFWGSLFFLFLTVAAFTTVLAVFENILACVRDLTGWSRARSAAALAVAIPLLSLPCVLGFNVWSAFAPLGAGSSVMDLEDFAVSNIILPLGGLAFALYCSHRFGWGWERFADECNAGAGPRLPRAGRAARALRLYCGYALPAVIFLIFVLGLAARARAAG